MHDYHSNYRLFFKGTFLVKGWEKWMREILKALSSHHDDGIEQFLAQLGEKIGREWAKDKRARKIDTPLLITWGESIRRAKEHGPAALLSVLKSIDARVDQILS